MSSRDEGILRIRIPDKLREDLELHAKKNRRSVTAEAVYRLERSFSQPELIDELRSTMRTEFIERLLSLGAGHPQGVAAVVEHFTAVAKEKENQNQ